MPQGKHETVVSVIVGQLTDLVGLMQLPECERLFEHVAAVPPSELDVAMVKLLKATTAHAMFKASLGDIKAGAARPSFAMLVVPLHRHLYFYNNRIVM